MIYNVSEAVKIYSILFHTQEVINVIINMQAHLKYAKAVGVSTSL